jgi:hypothetical protein
MSADGTKVAAGSRGLIYSSTDSGRTWSVTSAPTRFWISIASSADGSTMIAAAYPGEIYTSKDFGNAWAVTNLLSTNWHSVACSADGCKPAAAAVGNFGYTEGAIHTQHSTPSPALRIRPFAGSMQLSWTLPSMPFGLQQNPDSTTGNWSMAVTSPALNLTNLQYELLVPTVGGTMFYRLILE